VIVLANGGIENYTFLVHRRGGMAEPWHENLFHIELQRGRGKDDLDSLHSPGAVADRPSGARDRQRHAAQSVDHADQERRAAHDKGHLPRVFAGVRLAGDVQGHQTHRFTQFARHRFRRRPYPHRRARPVHPQEMHRLQQARPFLQLYPHRQPSGHGQPAVGVDLRVGRHHRAHRTVAFRATGHLRYAKSSYQEISRRMPHFQDRAEFLPQQGAAARLSG